MNGPLERKEWAQLFSCLTFQQFRNRSPIVIRFANNTPPPPHALITVVRHSLLMHFHKPLFNCFKSTSLISLKQITDTYVPTGSTVQQIQNTGTLCYYYTNFPHFVQREFSNTVGILLCEIIITLSSYGVDGNDNTT